MGANQSKTGGSGKRSPAQEKHTSADSTAPFAVKAADLDNDTSTTADKDAGFHEKSVGRSRANTMSFHSKSCVLCRQAARYCQLAHSIQALPTRPMSSTRRAPQFTSSTVTRMSAARRLRHASAI